VRSLARGWGRVLRGLTLWTACLFVPTAGHIVAGGGFPATGPLLFGAVLLAGACVALADRRLSAGGIAVFLLAAQPGFHVLLSLSGHGHDGDVMTPSLSMVAGHVAAAGVLTVLLAGGESVLWSMAALSSVVLLRRVRPLLRPTELPGHIRAVPNLSDRMAHTYLLSITRTAPRRGPPLAIGI
jgi:hypothetical protein